MAIVLGDNQYGKAEIRLLHVSRDGETHQITDLNVSVALSGDLTAVHLTGDPDVIGLHWAGRNGFRLDGASDLAGALDIVKNYAGQPIGRRTAGAAG